MRKLLILLSQLLRVYNLQGKHWRVTRFPLHPIHQFEKYPRVALGIMMEMY